MSTHKNKEQGGVASDSILLTFVKIVTLCVSIVQTMILSRSLPVDIYGTYSEGLLVISFFTPILSLGLGDAVNYFFNRTENEDQQVSYVCAVFSISAIVGMLGGFLILLSQKKFAIYFGNTKILPIIPYIAFRPLLQNLISLYQPLYISTKHSKMIAIRNLVVSIVQVFVVAIVTSFTDRISFLFASIIILDILQIIVFDGYLRRHEIRIKFTVPGKKQFLEIMAFALPILLSASIGTINLNLDKLMVSSLMSTEDYALYANVSKELPFSFVAASMSSVVAPIIISLINSGRMNEFREVWSDYLEFGYTVTWPMCFAAIVFAPQIIRLLYSATYLTYEGIIIFRVYTFVAMQQFTYFGMIPSAFGKTKYILRYSTYGMILNIFLNYLFYTIWGMIGPSIATAISTFVPGLLYFRTNAKLTGSNIWIVLKYKHMARLIIEMLVIGIISNFTVKWLGLVINDYIVLLILGLLQYSGLFYIFQYKNIKQIMNRLNKK